MTWPIITARIADERDVVAVRQRARRLGELLGVEPQDQIRLATAVSEIARNALEHGGGGMAEFLLDEAATPQVLLVCVSDQGQGMADLDEVLDGRRKSVAGMGVGLTGARRLADRFSITSTPGAGTTVEIGKALSRRAAPITQRGLAKAAKALAQDDPSDAAAAAAEQNRELLQSLQELTERQNELQRLNDELADTNRGVVALYAELEDAAEQVRQAGELKSRFLSNMTHEFRTPLNSIMALSRLLLDRIDGDLGSEQQKQVELILGSAQSLSELVNDLLDLAKADAGRLEVRPTQFQVDEMFRGLRAALRPLRTSEAVDLVFEPASDLPRLHTDEGKVAQVLRNFVSNALKFTERGEVCVGAAVSGRDHICFTVKDTGIGIDPADQQVIFQEFTQLTNRLQGRVKGTGLGLPLSRRLAELLGGEVGVDSAPGRGSTFWMKIPMRHPSLEQIPPRRLDQGLCVLVVDDDETFRYVFRQMLSGIPGRDLIEAAEGEQALQLLQSRTPDVIFLDLQMPGLDGFRLMERLQAEPRLRAIPVVVCTSVNIDNAARGALARAHTLLRKEDISKDAVEAVLASVVGEPLAEPA